MAIAEVIGYRLFYFENGDRPEVAIFARELPKGVRLVPTGPNAVFVADMLRNEKPVFWNTEAKWLSTSSEPIGEEETSG